MFLKSSLCIWVAFGRQMHLWMGWLFSLVFSPLNHSILWRVIFVLFPTEHGRITLSPTCLSMVVFCNTVEENRNKILRLHRVFGSSTQDAGRCVVTVKHSSPYEDYLLCTYITIKWIKPFFPHIRKHCERSVYKTLVERYNSHKTESIDCHNFSHWVR